LTEAEDALSEANILNNSDPVVWGYLTLVCLKVSFKNNFFANYSDVYLQSGRAGEAEQAYKFALKARLSDTALLEEIKELRKVNFTSNAFSEASNIEIV